MKTGNVNVLKLVVAAALLCSGLPLPGWQKPATPPTSSAAAGSDRPFVAEYYYKVKWGHAEEFITLFKKNHLPVLIRQVELGRIVEVTAATPRYHATEDGRWDYRVTIVFKNATVANETFDEAALARQLFPDQERYRREEQRRFEILDAHWDVPIKPLDLKAR